MRTTEVAREYAQPTECELCGESLGADQYGMYAEEVGEFWNAETQTSVVAHAQCGIDAELPMA